MKIMPHNPWRFVALCLHAVFIEPISSLKLQRNSTADVQLAAIVTSINSRFHNGKPSSDFTKAGVIMRAFDYKSDKPPFKRLPPWELVSSEDTSWSWDHTFFSASLVNARMPYTFIGLAETWGAGSVVDSAGLVISPEAAAASLSCIYPTDGMSDRVQDCTDSTAECVPGCVGKFHWNGKHAVPGINERIDPVTYTRTWCSLNTSTNLVGGNGLDAEHCAWRPDNIYDMMTSQEAWVASFLKGCGENCQCSNRCCIFPDCRLYNELIFNQDIFSKMLPGGIEAFYFLAGKAAFSAQHAELGEKMARAAQKRFQLHFNRLVPVVRVSDLSAEMPFEFLSS